MDGITIRGSTAPLCIHWTFCGITALVTGLPADGSTGGSRPLTGMDAFA
jgi:hypothetical protein